MTLEAIFAAANTTALVGWCALAASPLFPKKAVAIAGRIIPLLLAIAYAGLIFAFWSRAEGGFDTLANVKKLFAMPEMVLAGWLHYLAFDLFVGAWQTRTARDEAIPHLLLLPCLILTFLFGPVGLLAFFAVRAARAPGRPLLSI